MKFNIKVKDNKVAFFIELLKNLDFVDIEKVEESEEVVLKEKEKELLLKRLEDLSAHSKELIDWKDFKQQQN